MRKTCANEMSHHLQSCTSIIYSSILLGSCLRIPRTLHKRFVGVSASHEQTGIAREANRDQDRCNFAKKRPSSRKSSEKKKKKTAMAFPGRLEGSEMIWDTYLPNKIGKRALA